MKHGRPHWGEEATVGASPLKNYENKRFATYSFLWGGFFAMRGHFCYFFTYGNPFSSCVGFFATFFTLWEAFFAMWAFLLFCSPYRGIFSMWGAFLGLPPHPPYENFCKYPWAMP